MAGQGDFYRAGFAMETLSQDWLSHSLFTRLIYSFVLFPPANLVLCGFPSSSTVVLFYRVELRGGFLMQIMEQIRHAPGSAKVIARSVAVRKSLFSLTAGFCVLLLLIGNGETAEGGGTENATENLAFSGRVVNGSGDPVVGAEILYAVNWRTTQLVTRTAADGTFRFEIMRPEPRKSGGRLDILITHADYANRWRKLPLENTANIEIQLDAPGKITGRILNPSNEPISNAEVRIRFLMSGDRRSPHREDYSMLNIFHHMPPAETDERGEFIFRNLPQSAMTMLHLQAPGFAKAERFGVPVGAEGLDIRLKHEGRIEGRLSYADTGAPVTDATVTVRGTDFSHGRGEAHVDENGVFVVKNLPRGLYDLSLGVGPDGWTAISKGRILVTEGQTVSDVDLSLIRCGTITGRVTDTDTGEPIANHNVFFFTTPPIPNLWGNVTVRQQTEPASTTSAPRRVRRSYLPVRLGIMRTLVKFQEVSMSLRAKP